jgi:hypothetical protein
MRSTLYRLLLPVSVALAGCHPVPSAAPAPIGSVIGAEELLSTGRPYLLDALRVARPNYFSSRGLTTLAEQSLPPIVVVLEGNVLDIELLRATPVKDVVQVRRLSPSETFFRYNRSVSVGALEIKLRR